MAAWTLIPWFIFGNFILDFGFMAVMRLKSIFAYNFVLKYQYCNIEYKERINKNMGEILIKNSPLNFDPACILNLVCTHTVLIFF